MKSPRSARLGVFIIVALVALSLASIGDRSGKQADATLGPTGDWYFVDPHVHSAFSFDAVADLGIVADYFQNDGFDALFITDHQGGNAERDVWGFDDALNEQFPAWDPASFNNPSDPIAEIASDQFFTGSSSVHLRSESADRAESFIINRRGPSQRVGQLTLDVALRPEQIDPGSGVLISMSLGGDPTVQSQPPGYTSSANVVQPGKSIVLAWQLGDAIAATTQDPNRQVYVQDLGAYALNEWNTFTIDVSAAIEALPESDQPLDYVPLTDLKVSAVANGGIVDVWADSYVLSAAAPEGVGEEFVYRTTVVDDFNTESFVMYSSLEAGVSAHVNQFDYAITDPATHGAPELGTDVIGQIQQSGQPAMLNHPTWVTPHDFITTVATKGFGADFIEVREADFRDIWDAVLQQGEPVIGLWSTDIHRLRGVTSSGTKVFAESLALDHLVQAMYEGRNFMARTDFDGLLILGVEEGSAQPHPARYPIFVSPADTTVDLHLDVTDGLDGATDSLRWLVNGVEVATETPGGPNYTTARSIDLTDDLTVVRVDKYTAGSPRWADAATQSLMFKRGESLPAGWQVTTTRVDTPDGKNYTNQLVRGVTAAQFDGEAEELIIQSENPAGSSIEFLAATARPTRVLVDGTAIRRSPSLDDLGTQAEPGWFYDGAHLHVRAEHENVAATTTVDFGAPLGEVNCNSATNALDALFISQYQVALRTAVPGCPLDPGTEINLESADVTGDGTIDLLDALTIVQCQVGLPRPQCAELANR